MNNAEFVKKLVDSYTQGEEKPLKRYLYDKNARGSDLRVQYERLLQISFESAVGLNHRLNALAAAAHKAMEVMDESLVKEVVNIIKANIDSVYLVGKSNGLREDQTHIYYSLNACLLFSYIYLNDMDQAYAISEKVSKSVSVYVDEGEFTNSFYQTSTNIVRILLFKSYLDLVQGRPEDVDIGFKLMLSVVSSGVYVHDLNLVKFQEWFYAVESVNKFTKILQAYKKNDMENVLNLSDLHKLERRIVRPHCEEKYVHMCSNIRDFVRVNLSHV